jgi:hypothetical protein
MQKQQGRYTNDKKYMVYHNNNVEEAIHEFTWRKQSATLSEKS